MRRLVTGASALLAALFGFAAPGHAYLEQTAMGARGIALGTSNLASVTDVSALYWNPAALASLPGHELMADYSRPYGIDNLSESSLAYGARFLGTGFALGWHRLGITDVYAEDVFSLAAGRDVLEPRPGHRFRAGAAIKLERVAFLFSGDPITAEPLDFGSQARVSFDAALGWSTPWRLDFAWVGKDLFSPHFELVEGSGGGDVPFRQNLAAAFRWSRESTFSVAWSPSQAQGRDRLNLGLEIWFFDVFAVRSGITNLPTIISSRGSPDEFQYAGGFGIRHKDYRIDAAAFTNHDLGASYRASLLIPLHPGAR